MRGALFIPAAVLTKLVEGSYEARITRVQELVEEHKALIYGGSSNELQFRIGATYAQHAIVLSTDTYKPLVRIEYAEDGLGRLKLVGHAVVPVPTYDVTDKGDYARVEARGAVEALLSGDLTGAFSCLQESMECMGVPGRGTAQLRLELKAHWAQSCVWRKAMGGNPTQVQAVRRVLGESQYEQVIRCLPTVRYHKLYPNFAAYPVSTGDVAGMVGLLAARYEAIGRRVHQAWEGLKQVPPAQVETARTELATFIKVAEDLMTDASVVLRLAKEASRACDSVEEMVRVHDELAEALSDYEIATAFITSLTKRLTG